MNRTYGHLVRGDGAWGIRAEPHVMIKLKRLFPRLTQDRTGVVTLKNTLEIARDLEWFTTRYPLRMDEITAAYLRAEADRHRQTETVIGDILAGQRTLSEGLREPARTPRGYQLQAADIILATGHLLLADDVGLGKAQPVDAPVLTPRGFRPMGDLQVGDPVIAGDGTAVPVTGVFPQGDRDCYRITFSDGSAAECCSEHLWKVRHCHGRTRSKTDGGPNPVFWSARSLADLMSRGLRTSTGQAKWHVPMVGAPDLDSDAERPLDPYLLGVLLGDGGFTGRTVAVTTADAEIVSSLESAVPPGVVVKARSEYTYNLVWAGRHICECRQPVRARMLCGRCYQATKAHGGELPPKVAARHPIIAALRALGLWGHSSLAKFVPDAYKLAPAADRLAMLQGLMDTDGHAMPLRTGASAFFYSSSRQLAEDARWLAESLGGTGRLSEKPFKGRVRYTVTVKLPQPYNPFRLSRKAAVWGDGHLVLRPTRAIVAVEHVGAKPMQCISVGHADHLYVTSGFVVTHNTFSSLLVLRDPAALPALVVTLTHLPWQWLDELHKSLPWLHGHIVTKGRPYNPATQRGSAGHSPDVLIMGYSKLAGWADHLAGLVNTVIFDEIQELRRGSDSAKGQAAYRVSDKAAYRVGLSATPVFNYGGEIHNIMGALAPDALGTRSEFLREWGSGEHGMARHMAVGEPAALGTYLRDQGLLLRRTRKDVHREIPEPIEVEQAVDTDHATIEQVASDIAHTARVLLGETESTSTERFLAAGEVDWRMRQATGVAKAPYVAEFAKLLLESEQRIVLFGWHRECYDIWLDKLSAYHPVLYTGSESPQQKVRSADAFKGGQSRVLLMSLRSGAGLDGLQEWCSAAVFGELDWSPEIHRQCIGRLARDGQESTVVAYYMVSDDGTDPLMAEVLGIKKQQAEPIRDPELPLFTSLTPATDRAKALAATVLDRVRTSRAS